MGRISKFLLAEELAVPYTIDPEGKFAVDVDAEFSWETAYKTATAGPKFNLTKTAGAKEKKPPASEAHERHSKKTSWFGRKGSAEAVLPTSMNEEKQEPAEKKKEDQPFALQKVKLQIPKGSFIAVVGRVGSGKVCRPCIYVGMLSKVYDTEFVVAGTDR